MTDRPRLIALDPVAPAPAGLQAAADVLRRGGAVAFPTETFYGLAAAALDPASVKRIFALKGRPDSKPLLVLVDSVAMAETVADVTESARALMKRYWPGALTLVLPARGIVPSDVTAGTGTLGVRVSSHPIAHGLVKTLGDSYDRNEFKQLIVVAPERSLGEFRALAADKLLRSIVSEVPKELTQVPIHELQERLNGILTP